MSDARRIHPVVAIRTSVLFPHGVMPITVGRPRSVAAVEASSDERMLVVVAQKNPNDSEPGADDLYQVGTRVELKKVFNNNGSLEVLIQGVERVRLLSLEDTGEYLRAEVEPLPEPDDGGPEVDALHREIIELGAQLFQLAGQTRVSLTELSSHIANPLHLTYFLAPAVGLDTARSQQLLEAETRKEALELMLEILRYEVEVLGLRHQINTQARDQLNQEQKEILLRRQLKAIRDELGETDDDADLDMLKERLAELELAPEIRKEVDREIKRLGRLSNSSPDYQVTRTYLELVTELPWNTETEDDLDLGRARGILDEDHHGLKEIKERILEHLAVMKLNPKAKAPILCFVGPPGVGKTSLGQSIARALGRTFERMSLGGLHDEAELRGHRRTYIGAMPGRLIQAIRRAGARNPVLMLDEVDKLGRGFRGDPAAALLEVIDPAQNDKFRDNYLDLPFDLSKVFFIMTANSLDPIPDPLRDRMEIIQLSGYSEEEKLSIARQYLIPRKLEETGLDADRVTLMREALDHVITAYTKEAGVRNLERTLAKLFRKLALRFAEREPESVTVAREDLRDLLGPERFLPEKTRRTVEPGVAAGLAWTRVGGDILYVESLLLPGGKGLTLTGQLGDVMSESARAAQSYVLSKARDLRIADRYLREHGVHVHVPAGAIPKDGPSAGVTMAVSLASAYTGVPLRNDVAMTGEITLTGLVLPVGGIKEKVLAARRNGIKTVVLPRENEKDLVELPDHVREEMTFVLAETLEDVLEVVAPDLAARLRTERELLVTQGFLN